MLAVSPSHITSHRIGYVRENEVAAVAVGLQKDGENIEMDSVVRKLK